MTQSWLRCAEGTKGKRTGGLALCNWIRRYIVLAILTSCSKECHSIWVFESNGISHMFGSYIDQVQLVQLKFTASCTTPCLLECCLHGGIISFKHFKLHWNAPPNYPSFSTAWNIYYNMGAVGRKNTKDLCFTYFYMGVFYRCCLGCPACRRRPSCWADRFLRRLPPKIRSLGNLASHLGGEFHQWC